jgi:hypothetical protein
LSAALIC